MDQSSWKQQRDPRWPHLSWGPDQEDQPRNPYGSLIFMDTREFRLAALTGAARDVLVRESRDAGTGRRHLVTPDGNITIERQQDGWYSVAEVDLDEAPYRAFWSRLKELTDDEPELIAVRAMPWEREHPPAETGAPARRMEPDDDTGSLPMVQDIILVRGAEKAAGTWESRQTRDPVQYRFWHTTTPQGTITGWDDVNGWIYVHEVDLEPQAAREFRRFVRDAGERDPQGDFLRDTADRP